MSVNNYDEESALLGDSNDQALPKSNNYKQTAALVLSGLLSLIIIAAVATLNPNNSFKSPNEIKSFTNLVSVYGNKIFKNTNNGGGNFLVI
jgi:hypothetical protein